MQVLPTSMQHIIETNLYPFWNALHQCRDHLHPICIYFGTPYINVETICSRFGAYLQHLHQCRSRFAADLEVQCQRHPPLLHWYNKGEFYILGRLTSVLFYILYIVILIYRNESQNEEMSHKIHMYLPVLCSSILNNIGL